MLAHFLDANGIKQVELVQGLPADKAQVSRWVNERDANITRENIDRILGYLSKRLSRNVTYEEAFNTRAA
jgi:plasmid maintenance system antidote protein VapI